MTESIVNPERQLDVFRECRPELLSYATRLTARHEVAEELVQETAVRLLTDGPQLHDDPVHLRPWLFRVVTNLSIDYLRRHSTWREVVLIDVRARAEADQGFVKESSSLRGSPELAAIAREHLAVCFSCTSRNLPPKQSAALILKEIHAFSNREAADILDATPVQVKNWVQQARRTMHEKYAATCALVNKQGVCHQCVELDTFFNGADRDPLEGTPHDVEARLAVLRERRRAPLTTWHRRMLQFIDDALTR